MTSRLGTSVAVGLGSRLGRLQRFWDCHRTLLVLGTLVGVPLVGGSAVALEATIRARLTDSMFGRAARIYARPLVIERGQEFDRARTEAALARLGYRPTRRGRVDVGEYAAGSWEWVIGRRPFRFADRLDPGGIVTVRLGYWGDVSDIHDANGVRHDYVALEPELVRTIGGPSRADRIPVSLTEVPPSLVDAILTVEDQRFYEHHGLDFKRIAGATIANVRARRVVEGASTLTQQLAKNLFLSSRRSAVRKLREAAMAVALELRYTKDQILETYLNHVYLGQDGGLAVHGVGRAAQFYFGKDVSQLDLSEAALLAGIIRGPSLYSPFRHAERARQRRDLVLQLMRERASITDGAFRQASAARLGVRPQRESAEVGRYFADYVAGRLAAAHGTSMLDRGVAVFTTLDLRLQELAETVVRDELRRLERQYPRLARDGAPLQAALVAMDPRTGEILTMVGGRDYGASQFNRAALARRQPGSAFKPIVALAALARPESGRWDDPTFTLASTLQDEPLAVETPAGVWEPVNYDLQYRGPLTLRDALERSLNVPFARLGLAIGPERIVRTARKLGIESPLPEVPSLALGAADVTPLEMARAFGVIAGGGYRADLQHTLAVIDEDGTVLEQLTPGGERVYDDADAYLVTSALRGAVERGTGRGLRSVGVRGPVAAKSGTTNDFRDGWFIGYTPTLAVAVWVGFDDGRSLGLPGSRVALPIFGRFLAGAAHNEYPDFPMPDGLEIVEIDPETGLRAGPGCWGAPEVFLRGTAPAASCSPYWTASRRDRSSEPGLRAYVRSLMRELSRRLNGERR